MKALIMAAGKGSRISKHIPEIPKSFLKVGKNETIIENTVRKLKNNGINNIAICTGYLSEQIISKFKDYDNISFFHNPFFDITNSIVSLWFAKDFIDEDIILINGDTYFENSIIVKAKREKKNPVMFADRDKCLEVDYKFYYKNNKLIDHGKDLTENVTGEYIGLAKIQKSFIDLFKTRLNKLIKEQKHGFWWENVLYSFIGEKIIFIRDIDGDFWGEVDYIDDYERILNHKNLKIEDML